MIVALLAVLLVMHVPPCSAVHHAAQPAAGRPNTKQYIVHLSSVSPVLSYRGGVNGLRATATVDDEEDEYEDEEDADDVDDKDYGEHGDANAAPREGGASSAVLTVQQLSERVARIMRSTPWGRLTRPDVRLPHVQDFTRFLEASHRSLLQSLKIPSSAIFHSFAAQLTAAEVRRLKLHPAVADVERDRTVRVTSVHSPEFLKLDSSLWPANGGQSNAGEGVIIGVIDTGIWPEHPSFSNPDQNGVPYSAAPVRWRGVCSTTDDFTACNGKVVGARAAAGNGGVEVTTGGRTYGTASGMAPRARLAIYKALWNTVTSEGVGSFSDLVAAAENAVADGVDVISCSWGGPLPLYFQDLPYLRGLKAGMVTAFAAGNSGRPPYSKFMWGTLSTASPFYLTVGARSAPQSLPPPTTALSRSTMGRDYKAVVTLGDGTTLTGRSLGGNTATAPTATLSAFTVSYSSNAPQLAFFSSTGPPRNPLYPPALLIRDLPTNDILKPDVIGPGYQLWSAEQAELVPLASDLRDNYDGIHEE
ncbi:unnamed protein product [Closterium sp. Naga37s-1]|nr:unnamed protein product [Closterium sp. Naga37s-1]